jgi:dolichol-phosphate mannosyltransferase
VRVLVVLPTYNERENIADVLQAIRRARPDAEILVVDDSSPDGTAEIAKEVAAELTEIEVLVRPGKSGLGTAYREGFRWGIAQGYEICVEMDSDFSHDPQALPELLAPIESGDADVVIGSRYVRGGTIPNWSIGRRLLSRLGNIYSKVLLGLSVEDSTAGYRAYAASVINAIDLDRVRSDSYGFQIEMTYLAQRSGARIVEVPIHFVDREKGASKMSTFTVVEALSLVSWWGFRRIVRLARARLGVSR